MRMIQEFLCLKTESQLSERAIAHSLSISRSTVAQILRKATEIGISWLLPPSMDEIQLESVLFPEPDWSVIHCELRKKGVTLQLLWLEYKERNRDGYQYGQFCERYHQWKKKLQLSLRQDHCADKDLRDPSSF